MAEKCIAIITARGGSKRIPRKNIRNFLGKPIIEYSIRAALDAGIFDEVMVSTEDDEIATIARACGAAVPFLRSSKNSDDFASTDEVLVEVINEYRKRERHFTTLCCIYPTAPFVTAEKLRRGLALLEETQANAVFPLVRFSYPIQRALRIDGNGQVSMMDERYLKTHSQDLEPAYHDSGQFYFCLTSSLLATGQVISGKTVPLPLPETEVQDIDNEDDWKIAELKFRLMTDGRETSQG